MGGINSAKWHIMHSTLALSCHHGYTDSYRIFQLKLLTTCAGLPFLEGQGNFVSRPMTPMSHVIIPLTLIINLLTKSP